MISINLWLFAICFFGGLQCLFLACCFGLYPGENRGSQRLLSILMALLGGRILKSLWYVFEGEGMPLWIMNLGFAAHLAAAVVLYQYVRTQTGKSRAWNELSPVHLLPVVFILFGAPWLDLYGFWYIGAYHWLLIGSVAYWLAALKIYSEAWYRTPAWLPFRKGWVAVLLAGTGVFFWAYFANYVLRLLPYSIAPVVYSLAVFPVGIAAWYSFHPLKRKDSSSPQAKYQNLSPTDTDLERAKRGSTTCTRNRARLFTSRIFSSTAVGPNQNSDSPVILPVEPTFANKFYDLDQQLSY